MSNQAGLHAMFDCADNQDCDSTCPTCKGAFTKPIFVFGSNLAGVHGAGAAACAYKEYGAEWGVGEGLTGNSYALPTKDENIVTRPLAAIAESVERFKAFATAHPAQRFFVTRVGCGLAGYVDTQIAPLFVGAPANCELPSGWRELGVHAP